MGIYAFLLPSILVFLLFCFVPILTTVSTSFTQWDGYNPPRFNGLLNYIRLFSRSVFLISLRNLFWWSVIAGTLHVGFGVLVAFLLYRRPRGWKSVRAVFMIPNVISISPAAWAMIYRFMFNNEFGLFNGASARRTAWTIDLPLCRFSIRTGVILSVTSRIAMFKAIFLTTRGGPGDDTMNIPIILFRAVTDMNYGYANAAAVVMILLGIITMWAVNKGIRA